jgi:hypothetical protein
MRVLVLLIPAATLLLAAPASAAGEATPETAETTEARPPTVRTTPSLGLDSLLRPRSGGWSTREMTQGGKDEKTWRREFASVRAEVVQLEASLAVAHEKIRTASAGDWGYSPVGGHAVDPEVLKLRARLKRDKRSLDAARQRLRDLEIDASLAAVPRAWTDPETEPSP